MHLTFFRILKLLCYFGTYTVFGPILTNFFDQFFWTNFLDLFFGPIFWTNFLDQFFGLIFRTNLSDHFFWMNFFNDFFQRFFFFSTNFFFFNESFRRIFYLLTIASFRIGVPSILFFNFFDIKKM